MEMHQVRYFLAVARELNFTRAAESCNVAQPSLIYNAAVNQLNTAIQIFPGNVLAAVAGVQAMPFFEATAEARVALKVDDILGPA